MYVRLAVFGEVHECPESCPAVFWVVELLHRY
jgi:hypothetical protein